MAPKPRTFAKISEQDVLGVARRRLKTSDGPRAYDSPAPNVTAQSEGKYRGSIMRPKPIQIEVERGSTKGRRSPPRPGQPVATSVRLSIGPGDAPSSTAAAGPRRFQPLTNPTAESLHSKRAASIPSDYSGRKSPRLAQSKPSRAGNRPHRKQKSHILLPSTRQSANDGI